MINGGIFWRQGMRGWRGLPHPDQPRERWNGQGWLVLSNIFLPELDDLQQVPCQLIFPRVYFPGYFGCLSWFTLMIERVAGLTLVTATAPDGDSGTSITNRAEQLATWVCQALDLPLGELRWVEQYCNNPDASPALVTFDWRPSMPGGGWELVNPQWQPVGRVAADARSVRNPPLTLAEARCGLVHLLRQRLAAGAPCVRGVVPAGEP